MSCCRPQRRRRRDSDERERPEIFQDPAVRRRFIFKVLLIVALNLCITTMCAAVPVFHRPTRRFFRRHWYLWIVALCILLPIQIMLCYFRSLFRKSPIKYILLALYVFAHTLLVCIAVSWFPPKVVFMAVGICTGMVILLALFARFAPCDFTKCWTLVFVMGILLVVLLVLAFFFRSLRILYLSFGVLCYSFYLVVDLQMLVGGKSHKQEFAEEDYIIAALEIYGDIVKLFRYLLSCIGLLSDDD